MDATATAAAEPLYVGIDVSKDRLDIAVHPTGEAFAFACDAAGIDALAARLALLGVAIVALEATGGYETVVAASLTTAGLPVVVINPAQVRAFAQALGKRAKTDPIDAAVIARFAAMTKPPVRPLPDAATQRLADLVGRRRQIIAMMVAERQRLARVTAPRLRRSMERLLAALQRELSEVDAEIDEDVRGSPAWREKEDLLASVPGVGPVIARTLIAELPELGQVGRHAIAALAGLAPWAVRVPGNPVLPLPALLNAVRAATPHQAPQPVVHIMPASQPRPVEVQAIPPSPSTRPSQSRRGCPAGDRVPLPSLAASLIRSTPATTARTACAAGSWSSRSAKGAG